jgi:diguanylate cyclase (GGDEF)-like protein
VRALLHDALTIEGYEVREAADGHAALVALECGDIDVVLLDVEMPGLDGHQVMAVIAAHPDRCHTPVVFLTGRTDTTDLAAALAAGAHDYLRKPFEPVELHARVASAIRVKRLQDELRQRNDDLAELSRTDMLTGLPNRRALEDAIVLATAQARRAGQPLSLILLDLDHFKQINDQHGHIAGDEVLIELAGRLRGSVRDNEIIGRWGGEEFLAILPCTPLAAGVLAAERLRRRLRDAPVHSAAGPLKITGSFGVAAAVTGNPEAALRAADAALYEAKQRGRDQVVSTPELAQA